MIIVLRDEGHGNEHVLVKYEGTYKISCILITE